MLLSPSTTMFNVMMPNFFSSSFYPLKNAPSSVKPKFQKILPPLLKNPKNFAKQQTAHKAGKKNFEYYLSKPLQEESKDDYEFIVPKIHLSSHSSSGKQLFDHTVLPNGFQIVSFEDTGCKRSSLCAYFKSGLKNENPTKEKGFSMILNKLRTLPKDSSKNSKSGFAKCIIDPFLELDHSRFSTQFLRSDLEEAVQQMSNFIFRPNISDESIQRSLGQYYVFEKEQKQNPFLTDSFVFKNTVLGTCFGHKSPLANAFDTKIGIENEKAISPANLSQFNSKMFSPCNGIIAGVGVPHEKLVSFVKTYFSFENSPKIEKTRPKKVLKDSDKNLLWTNEKFEEVYPWIGGETRIEFKERPESIVKQNLPMITTVALGFPAVSMFHKNTFAFMTLKELLGGGNAFSAGGPGKGMTSFISTRYLPTGYFFGMEALYNYYTDFGIFYVKADCIAGQEKFLVPCVVDCFLQFNKVLDLSSIQSKQELEGAKNRIKSKLMKNLEEISAFGMNMASDTLHLNKFRDPQFFNEMIDSITLKDLREITEEMFSKKPFVVMIGDEKGCGYGGDVISQSDIFLQQFKKVEEKNPKKA